MWRIRSRWLDVNGRWARRSPSRGVARVNRRYATIRKQSVTLNTTNQTTHLNFRQIADEARTGRQKSASGVEWQLLHSIDLTVSLFKWLYAVHLIASSAYATIAVSVSRGAKGGTRLMSNAEFQRVASLKFSLRHCILDVIICTLYPGLLMYWSRLIMTSLLLLYDVGFYHSLFCFYGYVCMCCTQSIFRQPTHYEGVIFF